MRVLLIDPPWVVENEANIWSSVRSCLPCLGLATIAACLLRDGHEVTVLDCTAEQLLPAEAGRRMAASAPPDYVGVTATCATFENALAMAKISKELFPNAMVVFGGPHPTVDPEAALASGVVDAVAIGEGEETMSEIVSGKALREVDGIVWRDGDAPVHNPHRPPLKDLNSLPYPAYELLPMDKYRPAVGSYKSLPAMSMFATRGCPGRCTFCHRLFGGKLRARSAKNIAGEIRLLNERYGIKEIMFYDDTFTFFEKEVRELCRILIEEGPKVDWSCFTRVDRVDEEMLRLMKRSGCHLILFGVESSDPQILKNIRKGIVLEDAKKAVKLARKVGIRTRASFMFGNPGETKETVEATIRFAKELDPDQVQFNLTTAYPGTELYAWAKEHGYLATDKNVGWSMSDHNLVLPTISPEELAQAYRRAHSSFYVRPKVILRRLLDVRSPAQLGQEVKGGLAVLKSRFAGKAK